MFERPGRGERALLVHTESSHQPSNRAAEFTELARSAGASVEGAVHAPLERPHPRYFVGQGKAEEIGERAREAGAEVVLVDHDLSPGQERNLEQLLRCRVLDRAGLILDIFAQRARSHEGKLQVELAQLQHLSTRLVRGWSHLERQKGGIGLRGPGEKQLEMDRRLLGLRIKQIRRRLHKVRQQRGQGRQARRKAELPTVAIVGYTNAGKSTLFNRLTEAEVLAEDKLFATLDPTLRRLQLDDRVVILADTVGFISDLPHTLVDAFRATLDEVREADLLLHVVDAADDDRDERMADVARVLREIGAEDVPQLLVMNKIDRLGAPPALDSGDDGVARRVWVSASAGTGLDLLLHALAQRCAPPRLSGRLALGPAHGRLRSWLYSEGAVRREEVDEAGASALWLEIDEVSWRTLARRAGIDPAALVPASLAPPVEGKYNARLA